MAKKSVLFLLLPFALSALYYSLPSLVVPHSSGAEQSSPSQDFPSQWDIDVLLSSTGEYRIRKANTIYLGTYTLKARWKGCMEKDEEDFLLFHESCDLLEWDIQETANFPDSVLLLTKKEILDRPIFDFRYLLNRGGDIHFDFIVRGFYVPQVKSQNTFYLDLPTSMENSESSNIMYNFYVRKGTNQVSLLSEEIIQGVVEKTYGWQWNYQKWLLTAEESVLFTNSHDVEISLTVIPFFE